MSLTNVGARLGLYVCDLVKLGEAVGSCVGVFLLLSGALLLFELVDSTNKILSIEYAIVGFPVGLADLKEVVAEEGRKVGFFDLADGVKLGFLDAVVEGIIVVFFETASDGEKVETILVLVGITDGDLTIGAAELCRSLNEDVADKISVDFLEGSEVETFSVARNFTFCEVSVLNISAAVKILK